MTEKDEAPRCSGQERQDRCKLTGSQHPHNLVNALLRYADCDERDHSTVARDKGTSLTVRLHHRNRDAPPKVRRDRGDKPCHLLAAGDWLSGRTRQATAIRIGDNVRRKKSIERSKLAFLSGSDQRLPEAALLNRFDSPATSLSDVLPRASNQLSRIGLAHIQDLADLTVRIAEGFSKDIRSSLGGSKSFEQQQHREHQRLTALRSQSWIGAGVHWFRKPDPEVRFPPRPRGLDHVNR